MKKIDSIIRFIFMFVIFELFLLQLLIRVEFITTVIDYAFETLAIYIYNLIAYAAFLVYNLVVLILYKLFKYKRFCEISKKLVIISLVFNTIIILLSIPLL